jgi:hypothetical protein
MPILSLAGVCEVVDPLGGSFDADHFQYGDEFLEVFREYFESLFQVGEEGSTDLSKEERQWSDQAVHGAILMLECEVNIKMLTQGGFFYKQIFPEADRIYIFPRNYYGMAVVPISNSSNTIILTRYSISWSKKRESSPGGVTAQHAPGW